MGAEADDDQEPMELDARTEAIVTAVTARVFQQFNDAIIEPLGHLTASIVDATDTVRAERRGRRLTSTLGALAVVAVFSLIAALVWVKVDRNVITCDTRTKSRQEQRDAMEAGSAAAVEVVAEYANVPQADLDELRRDASEAAAEAVAEKLPPPDC